MKLISLNIWGGKIYKPLLEFIEKNSENTDILCFQEVFSTTEDIHEDSGFRVNLYAEIAKNLSHHKGYFAPCLNNYLTGAFQPNFTNYPLTSGLAVFIKKEIKVISHGDFFIYKKRGGFSPRDLNSLPRNIQYLSLISGKQKFTVCNLHGIWLKTGKNDSPARLKQSTKIKKFLDGQTGKKILCGDFNLGINTKSIKILENNLRNLIKEYSIKTTRNKHFPGWEKFADYTFVSPDINIKSFQVPDVDISDHLPMILEFS